MTHQPIDVQTIGSLPFSEYLALQAHPGSPPMAIAWLIIGAAIAIAAAMTTLRVMARAGAPVLEARLDSFGLFMLILFFASAPLLATAAAWGTGAQVITGTSLDAVTQTYGLDDGALDWVNDSAPYAQRDSRTRLAPSEQAQRVGDLTLLPGRWGVEIELSEGETGMISGERVITSLRVISVDPDGRTRDLREAVLDAQARAR